MSGRSRMPRHGIDNGRRGYVPETPYARPVHRLPHPALLEEELDRQHSDLERIMADKRRLVEDRIAMQQDLAAAQEELRRTNMVLADIQRDHDAQKRELIERGLKLEADLRGAEHLKSEIAHLKNEAQKLTAMRENLTVQAQNLTQELANAQNANKQIPLLKADMQNLHEELMRIRTAFEYEKKANTDLAEQRQAMEKNLVSMAREVEKLRAAGSESRPWAAGGAYGLKLGSPEGAFPSYADRYGLHSGLADKGPSLYGMGSGSWSDLEKHRLGRR